MRASLRVGLPAVRRVPAWHKTGLTCGACSLPRPGEREPERQDGRQPDETSRATMPRQRHGPPHPAKRRPEETQSPAASPVSPVAPRRVRKWPPGEPADRHALSSRAQDASLESPVCSPLTPRHGLRSTLARLFANAQSFQRAVAFQAGHALQEPLADHARSPCCTDLATVDR